MSLRFIFAFLIILEHCVKTDVTSIKSCINYHMLTVLHYLMQTVSRPKSLRWISLIEFFWVNLNYHSGDMIYGLLGFDEMCVSEERAWKQRDTISFGGKGSNFKRGETNRTLVVSPQSVGFVLAKLGPTVGRKNEEEVSRRNVPKGRKCIEVPLFLFLRVTHPHLHSPKVVSIVSILSFPSSTSCLHSEAFPCSQWENNSSLLVHSVDENEDVLSNQGQKEAGNEVIPKDLFVINCERTVSFKKSLCRPDE